MSDDLQNSSLSDINWTSSERPIISILSAAIGAAAGYVVGLQTLLLHAGQPLTPVLKVPVWVWLVVRRYGLFIPGPLGWLPATFAGACAISLGIGGWVVSTRPNLRHIRGLQIHTSPKKAAASFRPFQGGLKGISIHPKVFIGEHQECRHTLLVGGAGAGKTTILQYGLSAIQSRGDRCLVLDFKGDFTKSLEKITLLSPTDARGARWLLGEDIRTRLDAMALAETLIPLPSGGEMIWARGARGLLVGLVSSLQRKHKTLWGFKELANLACEILVNYKLLVSIVVKEHPPAKAYLMGADSKTTASFIAELSGALTHVIELGVSDYCSNPENGTWSVRRWLAQGKMRKTVVIGWRASSKEMSRAWAASIVEQVVRQMSDMEDCSPEQRRTWLILDEVSQLGRVPSVTDALVTLRSKGVRVILTVQSVAQVEQEYDRQTLSVWTGSTATKIICQLSSPEDQKFASSLLGEREVERYSAQVTQPSIGATATRSGSWQRVREPVVLAADLGHLLAPDARGATGIVLAGKSTAAMLHWPYFKAKSLRAPRKTARWIEPDFIRPIWGVTPAPVAEVPVDEGERLAPLLNAGTPNPPTAPPANSTPKPNPNTSKPASSSRPTPAPTQPPTPTPNTKTGEASRTKEEADPLAEIAGGALLDLIVPGASIVADIADKIGGASGTATALTQIPTSNKAPEQEPEEEDDGYGYWDWVLG